jgi:hypothetical protein
MSGPQFFETRMGRQFLDVTMPELVRQLHLLNELLALGIEQMEQNAKSKGDGNASDGPGSISSRQR